jgi:hypothetical protein
MGERAYAALPDVNPEEIASHLHQAWEVSNAPASSLPARLLTLPRSSCPRSRRTAPTGSGARRSASASSTTSSRQTCSRPRSQARRRRTPRHSATCPSPATLTRRRRSAAALCRRRLSLYPERWRQRPPRACSCQIRRVCSSRQACSSRHSWRRCFCHGSWRSCSPPTRYIHTSTASRRTASRRSMGWLL